MMNPRRLKQLSKSKGIQKGIVRGREVPKEVSWNEEDSVERGTIAIPPDGYYDQDFNDKNSSPKSPEGDSGNGDVEDVDSGGSIMNKSYESEKDNEFNEECSSSEESSESERTKLSNSYRTYLYRVEKLKETLVNWDKFLMRNHITRPDFFCRHKERESLQQIVDEFQDVTRRHRAGLVAIGALPPTHLIRHKDRKFDSRSLRSHRRKTHKEIAQRRSRSQISSRDSGNDASSSNEAAQLHQRLKHLSSELVTLRSIHVNGQQNGPPLPHHAGQMTGNHANNNNGPLLLRSQTFNSAPINGNHIGGNQGGYPNKPLPPHPQPGNNAGYNHTTNHNQNNQINNSGNTISGSSTNNNNNNNPGAFYVNQQFPKDVMRGGGSTTCPSEGKPSGSVIGTATTSGGDVSPSESSFKLSAATTTSSGAKVRLAEVEDLIHLSGPLTEDALIRCLQARCAASKFYAYMGPILLMANPLNAVGNSLTLSSTKAIPPPSPVTKVVQEALRQHGDTGYPQAIILSGVSGSGKTHASMFVLRKLYELAGGGVDTDAYKHLSASITVLRSLGTARTISNTESSRIGHFIQVEVSDGSVYRTKVHCYFLDQSRVVSTQPNERNYHIFYQMLSGLTPEERNKLHLGEHTVETLKYLNYGQDPSGRSEGGRAKWSRGDEVEDGRRFIEWKAALGVLGIPFLDVVRVLAAVILIGNVQFLESSSCLELDVEGLSELQAAAALLGVSETALKQGLTTRTHNVRNQLVRSRCDANLSNVTRDALAKSLYCRTVATIVRRANSLKRLGSNSGTLSSDSTDSVHNQAEVASQHASTVGTAGSKASKSMTALNNAVRHATSDGFIGILDMFGFEDIRPSHLEHLCINLCAETMQHFYNTHIFKACIESCRDEGIPCDWEIDYVDNIPCIDLISSLRTGLLSMLDVECSMRGNVEGYIQKVRTQHKQNPRLLETKNTDFRSFSIQHYAGKVTYDATDFLETNRDVLADDLVAVFHKHRCSFGFASHLFSSELKILGAGGMEPSPRGISFRISPTSHTELLNGDEPVSTLTQDFHTRLDNLLRTLVHARPHFIRCIKINNVEQQDYFDRHTVSRQLRAFQVLETVNLMANGYPHRMRFKAFNARYKLLAPFRQLSRVEERATEDCQLILEYFDNSLDGCTKERLGHISISWALGKRHIFLSEGARQQLESLRTASRNRASTIIQSLWRGYKTRVALKKPQKNDGFSESGFLHPPPVPPPNPPQSCPNLPHAVTGSSLRHHSSAPVSSNGPGTLRQTTSTSLPHLQLSNQMFHNTNPQLSPPPHLGVSCLNGSSGSFGPPVPAPRNTLQNTSSSAPGSLPSFPGNLVGSPNGTSLPSCGGRPRPQPISGTPPPDIMDRCDAKLVQQTCNLFGLDMERPPPLPPSRSYTVTGNTKLGYPQTRVMKMTFPDEGTTAEVRLLKGESVTVVGASQRRGHLMVEQKSRTIHVPFQYLELKSPAID